MMNRYMVALVFLVACAVPAKATIVRSWLFDMQGGNGGVATPGTAQTNGKYWNTIGGPANNNLKDTANNPTTLDLVATTGFGNAAFGLNPATPALGDLNVTTATQDYWNSDLATAGIESVTFELRDLDPNYSYRLRVFGARAIASTRITRYTVQGANGPFAGNLTVSDSGGANDDTILVFSNLTANALNRISVSFTSFSGSNFGYLNAFELQQIIPEPSTVLLLVVGGGALQIARRRLSKTRLA